MKYFLLNKSGFASSYLLIILIFCSLIFIKTNFRTHYTAKLNRIRIDSEKRVNSFDRKFFHDFLSLKQNEIINCENYTWEKLTRSFCSHSGMSPALNQHLDYSQFFNTETNCNKQKENSLEEYYCKFEELKLTAFASFVANLKITSLVIEQSENQEIILAVWGELEIAKLIINHPKLTIISTGSIEIQELISQIPNAEVSLYSALKNVSLENSNLTFFTNNSNQQYLVTQSSNFFEEKPFIQQRQLLGIYKSANINY